MLVFDPQELDGIGDDVAVRRRALHCARLGRATGHHPDEFDARQRESIDQALDRSPQQPTRATENRQPDRAGEPGRAPRATTTGPATSTRVPGV